MRRFVLMRRVAPMKAVEVFGSVFELLAAMLRAVPPCYECIILVLLVV